MDQLVFKNLFSSDSLGYSIPDYQRAYAWGEKQLMQFITDLKEQPLGKNYYLGHFLFERTDHSSTHTRFNIIDGQQRMTTTIIFFSALILEYDRRADAGAPALDDLGQPIDTSLLRKRYLLSNYRPRLRTVSDDHDYFERAILHQQPNTLHQKLRKAQERLNFAFEFFKKQLRETPTPKLKNWHQLVEEAGITQFEVQGVVEATQIFAFQNDRGIGLSELEKLKAYLMHRAYLDDLSGEVSETIKHVQNCFGNMFKQAERIDTVREDTLLRYHNQAFGSNTSAFEHVKKSLLTCPPSERAFWIKQFASDLFLSFMMVEQLENHSHGLTALTGILHLDAAASWPLLLKIQRFHTDEEPFKEQVFQLMETILFKYVYTVGSYRSNYFPDLARTYNGIDKSALVHQLAYWAESGFKDYWAFTTDFKRKLNGNYHYERTTRYLLWQYENHLRKAEKREFISGRDFLSSIKGVEWTASLDHIIPQNPQDQPHSDDFRDTHLNKLGNLSLMPLRLNISKSNGAPEETRAYQVSTQIADQEISELMKETGKWGAVQIDERTRRIVEFAEKRWRIES